MVDISVHDALATFEVEGADKLWALRSRLEIPLAHIRGVEKTLREATAAGTAAIGVHPDIAHPLIWWEHGAS